MSITKFIIAASCFMLASLGAMFGIAFLMGKFMLPPSMLGRLITNLLGTHGTLIVFITLCVLGVSLVFLLMKKIFMPKPEPKKK